MGKRRDYPCFSLKAAKMPRHQISEAYGWIHEVNTVPIYDATAEETGIGSISGEKNPVELDSVGNVALAKTHPCGEFGWGVHLFTQCARVPKWAQTSRHPVWTAEGFTRACRLFVTFLPMFGLTCRNCCSNSFPHHVGNQQVIFACLAYFTVFQIS